MIRAKFEIWSYNDTTYAIISKDILLSRRLNRFTGRYEKGTRFIVGDEPIFFVKKEFQKKLKQLFDVYTWPAIL